MIRIRVMLLPFFLLHLYHFNCFWCFYLNVLFILYVVNYFEHQKSGVGVLYINVFRFLGKTFVSQHPATVGKKASFLAAPFSFSPCMVVCKDEVIFIVKWVKKKFIWLAVSGDWMEGPLYSYISRCHPYAIICDWIRYTRETRHII